jgi:hypothetical protein
MCECGKLGVSTAGRATEAARITKRGELGVSIRPPGVPAWETWGFRADQGRIRRPSVWGNSGFPSRSRAKPPKCRESGSGRATDAAHVRVWETWGFHARPGDGSSPDCEVWGDWGFHPSVQKTCHRGKLPASMPPPRCEGGKLGGFPWSTRQRKPPECKCKKLGVSVPGRGGKRPKVQAR